MKFILDAHLPESLAVGIIREGFDCIHTSDLPKGNDTQDEEIIEYIEREERIIISKDADFYNSNLLRGKPKKILLLSTGNISNKKLKSLFSANFKRIISFYENGAEVIEMNLNTLYLHK